MEGSLTLNEFPFAYLKIMGLGLLIFYYYKLSGGLKIKLVSKKSGRMQRVDCD